ncbi:hypothetical protein JHK82_019009 [Glycine max]|nr:hypothetical protein JHK82_019009 [Glycine max]
MPPITFMSNDFKAINPVQDDPMVISVEIANNTVKKTFVDQGSLTDILFWNIFKKMDIPESKILPHDDPLFSFAGEQVGTKGCIWLYTKENYMVSLRLQPHAREESPEVVHYVEARMETEEVEELEIDS